MNLLFSFISSSFICIMYSLFPFFLFLMCCILFHCYNMPVAILMILSSRVSNILIYFTSVSPIHLSFTKLISTCIFPLFTVIFPAYSKAVTNLLFGTVIVVPHCTLNYFIILYLSIFRNFLLFSTLILLFLFLSGFDNIFMIDT